MSFRDENIYIATRILTKLQSFEMWAHRKMVKIPWRENKTNEEVLKMADEHIYLKLYFRQYPAIHTNYSSSNCTISN